VAAAAATLSIGLRDPRTDYFYECVLFALASGCCFRVRKWRVLPARMPGWALAAILGWGFFQLALGWTVYRYATLQAALRGAALASTAFVSCRAFGSRRSRLPFLRAFAWFGGCVAVTSVLAYCTSPGKILWTFQAPYPDIWGPFLSRNNFAQFLELALPAALWLGFREPRGSPLYLSLGAIMLASGLASAARAGSAILVLETMTLLWMHRQSLLLRRSALTLIAATILFAALPGIGDLEARWTLPDPYQGRREIARSTLAMISARPWDGFGLGTFSAVYPAYAELDMGQTVEHAHNDWLEWCAEGGIPYAAMWVAMAIWAARPAWRSGWGIGVLGCFLHAAVDYPFARFGISAWTFLLIGMLAASQSELREVCRPAH
jgi:O-antigen ligase